MPSSICTVISNYNKFFQRMLDSMWLNKNRRPVQEFNILNHNCSTYVSQEPWCYTKIDNNSDISKYMYCISHGLAEVMNISNLKYS